MAKILIVEDEAVVAMEYKNCLLKNGHIVLDVASSVEKALLAFHNQTPDLMLVDIKLKGERTGLDFANEIRKLLNVPIIFLSGNSDPITMESINKVTNSFFLSKPILTNLLNSKVTEVLSGQK